MAILCDLQKFAPQNSSVNCWGKSFIANCFLRQIKTFFQIFSITDGIHHTVEILDTAGTHYFPAMRELSIHSGRGFVLVFSLDSIQSFHETVTLYENITKIRGKKVLERKWKLLTNYLNFFLWPGSDVAIVLVGNKSDLEESNRKVDANLIDKTRTELMNNIPYVETSAKFNLNVNKLFMELLLQTRQGSLDSMNLKKNRKLIRRLGSFGSLPNISLIRRKPSATRSDNNKNGNNLVHHQLSLEETNSKNKPDPGCTIS